MDEISPHNDIFLLFHIQYCSNFLFDQQFFVQLFYNPLQHPWKNSKFLVIKLNWRLSHAFPNFSVCDKKWIEIKKSLLQIHNHTDCITM